MKTKKHAIYLSDDPFNPLIFNGTKTDARKAARLYIKQWNLDAKVERIEVVV